MRSCYVGFCLTDIPRPMGNSQIGHCRGFSTDNTMKHKKKMTHKKIFLGIFFLLLFSPLNNKSVFHWWSLFLLNPQIFFPEVNKNSSLNLLNTHISITLFHIIFLHHSNSHGVCLWHIEQCRHFFFLFFFLGGGGGGGRGRGRCNITIHCILSQSTAQWLRSFLC